MRIWQTGPVRSLGVSAGAVQSLLMASIERRTRADGRVAWDARYRDPAGVQRKRTFSRKIDAQRYLTSIESAKNAGMVCWAVRTEYTRGLELPGPQRELESLVGVQPAEILSVAA